MMHDHEDRQAVEALVSSGKTSNNGSPFEDNGNAIQWQEIFFACNVVRPMAAVHGHEALPSLMHDPYDAVIDSRLLMQQIPS